MLFNKNEEYKPGDMVYFSKFDMIYELAPDGLPLILNPDALDLPEEGWMMILEKSSFMHGWVHEPAALSGFVWPLTKLFYKDFYYLKTHELMYGWTVLANQKLWMLLSKMSMDGKFY